MLDYELTMVQLIEAIKNGDAAQRDEAIFELGNQGSRASQHIPYLLSLASEHYFDEVAGNLLYAISEIGLREYVASDAFLRLFALGHTQKLWAFALLGSSVDDYAKFLNDDLVKTVVGLLVHKDERLNLDVYITLGAWHPHLEKSLRIKDRGLEYWKDLLHSHDAQQRLFGIVGLSHFGKSAGTACMELMADPDPVIREFTVRMCFQISSSEYPLIDKGCSDIDENIREAARSIRDRDLGSSAFFQWPKT